MTIAEAAWRRTLRKELRFLKAPRPEWIKETRCLNKIATWFSKKKKVNSPMRNVSKRAHSEPRKSRQRRPPSRRKKGPGFIEDRSFPTGPTLKESALHPQTCNRQNELEATEKERIRLSDTEEDSQKEDERSGGESPPHRAKIAEKSSWGMVQLEDWSSFDLTSCLHPTDETIPRKWPPPGPPKGPSSADLLVGEIKDQERMSSPRP